jgi:hypothetical protein
MRPSIPLLIGTVLAMATVAATSQAQSVAAPTPKPKPAHHAHRSHSKPTPSARVAASLALGATDITGNKELPKVMVIVPWKDSLGAGGVIKPTDSLMDDVLQPVDRGVFQRQIRYYGQLGAAAEPAAAASGVAPVGDSH